MGAPSPVGIYIRSIPEPILIENIRLISKKQINTETIKNSKKEKIDEEIDITKTAKENEEVTPVLPAVLHTAAPSIVNQRIFNLYDLWPSKNFISRFYDPLKSAFVIYEDD